MVMVLTDAGFKTALDGKVGSVYTHTHTHTHTLLKVGALLTRNDGECHLRRDPDKGFYEYSRTPEQVRVCQNRLFPHKRKNFRNAILRVDCVC